MTHAPYPPGHDFSVSEKLKRVAAARSAPLDYFASTLELGDISYMRIALFGSLYIVNEPTLVREVLVKKSRIFQRHERYTAPLKKLVGNGILSTDGDSWLQQRRLVQPAFHHKRIASYADIMTGATLEMLAVWRSGETRDLSKEMMALTLTIVARALFGAETGHSAQQVAHAIDVSLRAMDESLKTPIALPAWVPMSHNHRLRSAVRVLDDILMPIIQARRASNEDTGDLLSMLLQAVDEERGVGMDDQQLRDELMTMFLAGHETTSNALTWTWILLAQHSDVLQTLQQEVDSALNGRVPTLADLAQMPYTAQVVKESMRLYPPAWAIVRTAVENTTLGGYRVDKGCTLFVSPYVMHRNPRFFPDPERFDPERFSAENEAALPRGAYMPFGDGPHICIGNTFAMMEARLILATMVQRFNLTLLPNQDIEPEAVVTLRPKGAIHVQLTSR